MSKSNGSSPTKDTTLTPHLNSNRFKSCGAASKVTGDDESQIPKASV